MISLPTITQLIVEDTNDDLHIDQNDLDIKLTYAEHEMLCDVLLQAVNMMEFSCPNGYFDLPMSSELIQRFSMIENIRERFNTAWSDRFNNNN
jgi:hypothetical protein